MSYKTLPIYLTVYLTVYLTRHRRSELGPGRGNQRLIFDVLSGPLTVVGIREGVARCALVQFFAEKLSSRALH